MRNIKSYSVVQFTPLIFSREVGKNRKNTGRNSKCYLPITYRTYRPMPTGRQVTGICFHFLFSFRNLNLFLIHSIKRHVKICYFSIVMFLLPLFGRADTYPVNKNIDIIHYSFSLSTSLRPPSWCSYRSHFKNIVEIALRGCQNCYRLITRLRLFLEHFRDILQNLFDLIFKSLMGETLRMKNLNDFGFYYDHFIFLRNSN
jgi:hypothetical protein